MPHAFLPKVLARGFQVTGIDTASVVRANVLNVFRRRRHVELLHTKLLRQHTRCTCFELCPCAQGPRRSGTPSRMVALESPREGRNGGSASSTCVWFKAPFRFVFFITLFMKALGFLLPRRKLFLHERFPCACEVSFCFARGSLNPVWCGSLQ